MVFVFLAGQEAFMMKKNPSDFCFIQAGCTEKEQGLLDKEAFVSDDEMKDVHVSIQMAALR